MVVKGSFLNKCVERASHNEWDSRAVLSQAGHWLGCFQQVYRYTYMFVSARVWVCWQLRTREIDDSASALLQNRHMASSAGGFPYGFSLVVATHGLNRTTQEAGLEKRWNQDMSNR